MLQRFKNWIDERKLEIKEAGLRLRRAVLVRTAISEARQSLADVQTLLAEARSRRDLVLESLSEFVEPVTTSMHLSMRFKPFAHALLYVIVGSLLLELIVAGSLAENVFWFWAQEIAIIATVSLAMLLAAICHGIMVNWWSSSRPLRQIRLLRLTVKITAVVCFVLLVPMILSRVIAVPDAVTNSAMGLLGIALPLLAGAASALRRILHLSWEVPVRAVQDMESAQRLLRMQISDWEEDLRILNQHSAGSNEQESEVI